MDQTRKGVFKGNRKSSSQTKTKKKSAEDDKTKMQASQYPLIQNMRF